MQTITTTFQEIKLKASKSGKCVICSKSRRRSKTFSQTLNPFNKTESGDVKSISTIRAELADDILAWKKEPINCCS